MTALRPYQLEAVDRLEQSFKTNRRICLQMPTGSGKTVVFSHLIGKVNSAGDPSLILVHKRELIKQTLAKLNYFEVDAGVIAPGWPRQLDKGVQVASIQTLTNRLGEAPPARFVVVDEAHHSTAPSWAKILQHYSTSLILGPTATPERPDGKGLDTHFDALVRGPTPQYLVDEGYLADVRIITARSPDVSHVKKVGGDYHRGQLGQLMSSNTIIGNAVEHYQEHADGLPGIAFCCTVEHAQLVAKQFQRAGYRAASVDGSMPTEERDDIINGLSSGALQIVTSCDLISEGLDIPDVAVAILLRQTQSLVLYLQQVGRAMRPKLRPAIILDHAGNFYTHGSPKMERLWSLAGKPVRQKEEAAAKQVRKEEFRIHKLVKELNGRLVELGEQEITATQLRTLPLNDVSRHFKTWADLHLLAKLRGLNPRWVWQVMQARRRARANRRVAEGWKRARTGNTKRNQ